MGGKEGDGPRGATLYWSSVNPVKKIFFKNPALAGSFAGGHAVVCDFLMKAKTQPLAQLAWKTDGVTRLSRYSGAAVATVTVQPEGQAIWIFKHHLTDSLLQHSLLLMQTWAVRIDTAKLSVQLSLRYGVRIDRRLQWWKSVFKANRIDVF